MPPHLSSFPWATPSCFQLFTLTQNLSSLVLKLADFISLFSFIIPLPPNPYTASLMTHGKHHLKKKNQQWPIVINGDCATQNNVSLDSKNKYVLNAHCMPCMGDKRRSALLDSELHDKGWFIFTSHHTFTKVFQSSRGDPLKFRKVWASSMVNFWY